MLKHIIIILILINISLLGCQYVFTSMRATEGQVLADLSVRLQDYSVQNQQLRNAVFSALALNRVQIIALQQSMAPAQTSFLAPNPVAAAINFP